MLFYKNSSYFSKSNFYKHFNPIVLDFSVPVISIAKNLKLYYVVSTYNICIYYINLLCRYIEVVFKLTVTFFNL